MTIPLDQAHRLFAEARNFTSERVPYLPIDSEIRRISVETYGRESMSNLTRVCHEIYYVLACEFMDVPR